MTIITRSALVFHGHNPPPNVARVLIDPIRGRRVITWDDVMRERREGQHARLERKRSWGCDEWRACKLWVAYFDMFIFGGWQAFLEDYRGRDGRVWIDRHCRWLVPLLLKLFPLVLPFGNADRLRWEHEDAWASWKPVFARQFQRRRQDRKPLGAAYVWWNRRDAPRLITREAAHA